MFPFQLFSFSCLIICFLFKWSFMSPLHWLVAKWTNQFVTMCFQINRLIMVNARLTRQFDSSPYWLANLLCITGTIHIFEYREHEMFCGYKNVMVCITIFYLIYKNTKFTFYYKQSLGSISRVLRGSNVFMKRSCLSQ